MEKVCKNCRFFDGRDCVVPLYVDGEYYPGRETEPEKHCELYEERDALPQ